MCLKKNVSFDYLNELHQTFLKKNHQSINMVIPYIQVIVNLLCAENILFHFMHILQCCNNLSNSHSPHSV